ncbi:sulfatase-like hydrolase/transferase [Aestuariibaculum sp. YM273]|uniref:sulfatase-like hydrolase/transferase n=1 Tax=Aestuariibaculum sp. YM273 TaxID=3070659 RepID=UPI0027DE6749|nr:sulfatase-like hydrolase/transferase [Aestuariibaculum sp. YM273]WMI65966.1 sulfatase-like hydrolase/transferase [Aestuariibaculum sp. YM273]
MRKLRVVAILLLVSLTAGACLQKMNKKNDSNIRIKERTSPNLIVILADDLGYGDVGFNGCKDIPTPNIDRIASQGVKFTNGYVSYAVCGPSRAGLITGRYQDQFGFSRNPLFTPNDPEMGLPLTEETLAEALKKTDYKSIALGKWHLGAHESLKPLERGFDDFYGFLTGGHHYFPEKWVLQDEFEVKSQYDAYKTKLLRNSKRVEETEYLTDALSREAVQYIDKYKDSSFFMYLAYNAPHTPLQATEKYLNRFDTIQNKKRRTYAAMVSAVDDGVGRVLEQLEALKLTEKTIVVFLSDNGGPEPHNGSDNGELRGMKSDLFEGGIRVPFAMQWPGTIPSGMVYNKPVISLDIFGTIINQTKKTIKTKNKIDGVDLMPFLLGENKEAPHDYLFWRKYDEQIYAARNASGGKFVVKDQDTMLFNLDNDISETENLIRNSKNKLDSLEQVFNMWNLGNMDPVFMGLIHNKKYNELNPDRFEKLESKNN